MKTASEPGVVHFSKRTMWPPLLRFAASPGRRSLAWMTVVMSVSYGANSPVTRPGAGRFHAHEMKPEQSDRYGSHSALLSRTHVDAQAVSPSGLPFALWQ